MAAFWNSFCLKVVSSRNEVPLLAPSVPAVLNCVFLML